MRLGLATGTFLPGDYGVGVSDDSETVRRSLRQAVSHMLEPRSIGGRQGEALTSLYEAFVESAHEDWDGYGANPAKRGAYNEAQRLISMLPTTTPEPDVGFDPEGDVELNWFTDGGVLSLTITESCLLIYAGSFPLGRFRGSEYFGNEVPPTIARHIEEVLERH